MNASGTNLALSLFKEIFISFDFTVVLLESQYLNLFKAREVVATESNLE